MKTVLVSAMLLASAATASWAAATCLPIVTNAPVVDGIVVGGDIGRPDTVKIPASCPTRTADPGWAGVSGRGIDHVAGPAGLKTPTLFFATHQGDGASMDKIFVAVHVEKAPDFTTNDQLTIYFQEDARKGDWTAKDFALVFDGIGPGAATPGNDACTSPKDPRYFTRAPDNARWVAQATVPAGIVYKASYAYDRAKDPQFPLWELEIGIDVSNAGMNLNIVKSGQIGLGAKLYLFEAGTQTATAYHYPGPITGQNDLTPIPDSGIDVLPNQGGVTPFTLDKVTVGGCEPPNNIWATKMPMPTARERLGLAVAGNGKLYAVGGHVGRATLRAVEEYDPATNTWATKQPMPTARAGLALAAAGNGKLYAIGGMSPDSIELPTVEEYDPATDSWATKKPMPTARADLGLVAAGNGKLYAVGGAVLENAAFPTVEEYDPAMDSWATKKPMSTARQSLGLAAAANGKLYAIGGEDFGTQGTEHIFLTVEEYDPAKDSWATMAPMPTARTDLGLAAASNGKLYAVGGFGTDLFELPTAEEYDPATNSWATRKPMPTARARLGLAAAGNGKLYAVGGRSESMALEEYTP